MLANVVYRLVYGDFLRLLPFRLVSLGPSRLAIRRRSSHVAESGVGVLHLVIFRLSLCRRDPGSLHRNAPPGVVWSGDSPDYLGNTCILLVRILCGHHRLKSRGPSAVSFRSRLWTVRCIHSVVVSCRPYIPLPVRLPVSGLRGFFLCWCYPSSSLAGLMVFGFRQGVVSRLPS